MMGSLGQALSNIRRSPFQALAAISVLSITFFVGTLLAVVLYSSNQIVHYFETKPQVIAFLTADATSEEITSLQAKLNSDSRIASVRYESKEGALEIYKQATADNPLLSELVSPSIFPDSLEFSLTDITFADQVVKEIRQNPIVEQIGFTASLGGESGLQQAIDRIKSITTQIRLVGVLIAAILVATSLLILLVIISMRMNSRKSEIEILRLIGAKSGFIRGPIVTEALFYSSMGVFIGWVSVFILFLYSTPTLFQFFQDINILPSDTIEFVKFFLIILGIELSIGMVLALFGSLIAITRVKNPRNQRG